MGQPTFDGTLTWLHFNFLLSQNSYRKLRSQKWQIHGTCATRAPLHIHCKPSILCDRPDLRGQQNREFQ